jgi:hypothetical protein
MSPAASTSSPTPADADAPEGPWRALRVEWQDGAGTVAGWWRAEPGWVMAIAGRPAPGPPRRLDGEEDLC